jgi:putative transposase
MKQHPDRPQRRSIRLKNYDYSQGGSYFITICINDHRCLLGSIINGTMQFSSLGESVQEFWLTMPLHFPNVILDDFVVMPNHLHGILTLSDYAGAACCAPTKESGTSHTMSMRKLAPHSLPVIIRSYKSAVTKRFNEWRKTSRIPIWQRGYYEHIIRNESELNRIREYIHNNPLKWDLDRENSESKNYNLNQKIYWQDIFNRRGNS